MTLIASLTEIDALVSLLDEPNETIFREIQQKVISFGNPAIPYLEEAWLHNFNTTYSKRLENTIDQIKFHQVTTSIHMWIEEDDLPPTDLLHTLAVYIDEHYDLPLQQKWVNQLFRDCWLEHNENLTALEEISVINHVLYSVHGYVNYLPSQNKVNGFFPDSFHYRKTGNAMSMGFIYLMIAQKLNIPLKGINLPDQFILAYLDSGAENRFLKGEDPRPEDVLFYLNPANSGAIFTINEINRYGAHLGISDMEKYYYPCSRKEMAVRLLSELHKSLMEENRLQKGDNIFTLLQSISDKPIQLGQATY